MSIPGTELTISGMQRGQERTVNDLQMEAGAQPRAMHKGTETQPGAAAPHEHELTEAEQRQLTEMLLKVADIEERHMRSKTKTLISLLAPAMILVVGALVGFMVIALLLPIFRMSTAIH